MAPLPPAFDDAASSALSSIRRRSRDVEETQIPRLRSCKESLAIQQQYAAELQEDLDTLTRLVEELDDMSEDQKGARARRELKAVAGGFRGDISRLRKEGRAALLFSKRAIDATAVSKREELLRSNVMREKQTSEGKIAEDSLMKAHNDVTDAMRRTLGLMHTELERSVLSTQMLEASTATLKSTSETHDVLTGLLGTSKQLITALQKTDWMDRLLIFAALGFFFLVVILILKQRILDRSLRIALFWTRFLPSSGSNIGAPQSFSEKSLTTTASSLLTVSTTVAAALSSAASEPAALLSTTSTLDTAVDSFPLTSYVNSDATSTSHLSQETALADDPSSPSREGLVTHDEL